MRLLGSHIPEPVAPLDAQLGVNVICVGRMHNQPQNGCYKEAADPWKEDLCPVDAIILHIE